jgi:Skp family chaperone for outer membrane proteins
MKIRTMILSCLMGVIVLSFAYEYSRAGSGTDTPAPKIAVVSVLKIFQECKKNDKFKQEYVAENNKVMAEMEKLSKEIEAEKAGLKTLKAGSNNYMSMVQAILQKQASLQAQEEFHKQQMALKEQQWTEEIYKDILRETRKVAEQKGLQLVLEKDEPVLPCSNYTELMTVISTHKVLYDQGCLEITAEVMAGLDAEQ